MLVYSLPSAYLLRALWLVVALQVLTGVFPYCLPYLLIPASESGLLVCFLWQTRSMLARPSPVSSLVLLCTYPSGFSRSCCNACRVTNSFSANLIFPIRDAPSTRVKCIKDFSHGNFFPLIFRIMYIKLSSFSPLFIFQSYSSRNCSKIIRRSTF